MIVKPCKLQRGKASFHTFSPWVTDYSTTLI